MQFVFFALQPIEETLYTVIIVFRIALENEPALVCGEMPPSHVRRNALRPRPFFQFLKQRAVARLVPRLDSAIIDRFARIRHDKIQIEIDGIAEALATRASTVGIVERKQTRLRLLILGSIVFAFEAFVEDQTLGGIAARVRNEFQNRFASRFAIANLDGINEPRA